MQKVYTVDFLTKKKKVNQGEVPQYYVEGNHEAIIPPAVFDEVQKQIAARCQVKNRLSSVSTFSGKIKCGDCGSWYGAKVWHSNDKYRRTVWQCNHKFDGGEKCATPHLEEETIKKLFIKAISTLFTKKEEVLEELNVVKDIIFDTSALEVKLLQLQRGISIEGKTDAQLDTIREQIVKKQKRKKEIDRFLTEWKCLDKVLVKFDEDCWYNLVEWVTVFRKEEIYFTFKNGMTIKV